MNIGWVGTGIMGAAMAGRLQVAGHALHIFNRSRVKAEPLLAHGAQWYASPAAVASVAEIVFTIVGFPADVEEVYFGARGIFATQQPACSLVVDMTTSPPELARRLAATAVERGMTALDAPVTGGDVGARDGTLVIMVGGAAEAFERVLPLLRLMGRNVARVGGPGAGQQAKLVNQILIAGAMIGVCEALLVAARAGLNSAQLITLLGEGAAGSWALQRLGPRLARGDYAPGFMVEHFLKDLGLALREAAALGLKLPGVELAEQLYEKARILGHGRSGTQALIHALEDLNAKH
jgi:3-hydroxyisobutyrate dehydrogenase